MILTVIALLNKVVIIRQELGLDRPVSASSVSSLVFQAVFDYLMMMMMVVVVVVMMMMMIIIIITTDL
jgi:hypothetical protein